MPSWLGQQSWHCLGAVPRAAPGRQAAFWLRLDLRRIDSQVNRVIPARSVPNFVRVRLDGAALRLHCCLRQASAVCLKHQLAADSSLTACHSCGCRRRASGPVQSHAAADSDLCSVPAATLPRMQHPTRLELLVTNLGIDRVVCLLQQNDQATTL